MAYATMVGLADVEFGARFEIQGTTYSICGLKPRSRKYPVLAKQIPTGKTYKFAVDSVKKAVGVGHPLSDNI